MTTYATEYDPIGVAELYEPYVPTLEEEQAEAEAETERAYVRYLEDGGPHQAMIQAEQEYEDAHYESFEDAYDRADPAHAAERPLRHAEIAAYEEAVYRNGKTSEGLDNPGWQRWMDRKVDQILAEQGLSRQVIEDRMRTAQQELDRRERMLEDQAWYNNHAPAGSEPWAPGL